MLRRWRRDYFMDGGIHLALEMRSADRNSSGELRVLEPHSACKRASVQTQHSLERRPFETDRVEETTSVHSHRTAIYAIPQPGVALQSRVLRRQHSRDFRIAQPEFPRDRCAVKVQVIKKFRKAESRGPPDVHAGKCGRPGELRPFGGEVLTDNGSRKI